MRPGECPALLAEELSFEKSGRDRRTIKSDHGSLSPLAQPVKEDRGAFLAGACFARQQDCCAAGGEASDQPTQILHRIAVPDEFEIRIVRHGAIRRFDMARQNCEALAFVCRGLDEIVGAGAERFHT